MRFSKSFTRRLVNPNMANLLVLTSFLIFLPLTLEIDDYECSNLCSAGGLSKYDECRRDGACDCNSMRTKSSYKIMCGTNGPMSPEEAKEAGMTVLAIVGISLAVCCVVIIAIAIVIYCVIKKRRPNTTTAQPYTGAQPAAYGYGQQPAYTPTIGSPYDATGMQPQPQYSAY